MYFYFGKCKVEYFHIFYQCNEFYTFLWKHTYLNTHWNHRETCLAVHGAWVWSHKRRFLGSLTLVTARVRSTREGNVLTRVCPSINLSVHRGGYPYPIMLCNISQNAMRQPGGYPDPPPPGGVPRSGYPPGGGYRGPGTPPGGGTRVGQQKEYSLHGGRYASCVHAGGLSCLHNVSTINKRSLLHVRSRLIFEIRKRNGNEFPPKSLKHISVIIKILLSINAIVVVVFLENI